MLKNITIIFFLFSIISNSPILAGTITGVVKSEDGSVLPGASVTLVGKKLGDNTDKEGKYEIKNVRPGNYTIRASYMGYSPDEKSVTVKGSEIITMNFKLGEVVIESEAISVIASRAQTRETPVAFSDIPKAQIAEQLGSRDIPMILNTTPGVYASEQGGSYGESRINIRGFDQRNVSVMFNGVPVNDMENGWVYWANWDGLGDVTSSIQVQRGLGAGRLANPSVGGTLNIVSDAAQEKAGISFKQEMATGNFLKTTLIGNTGKIGNFAATVAAVRKTADGVVEKAWTDSWTYYLGMSYDINPKHKIDFYLMGAPQEHGQRYYQPSIAAFDKELAAKYGADTAGVIDIGYTGNKDWGAIKFDPTKPVKEFYNGSVHDLYNNSFINTRVNYFHKPQVNLNWFWKISDNANLTNVFYFSRGIGGGAQVSGFSWDSLGRSNVQENYDYNTSDNAIDRRYSDTMHKAKGYLRNSVNQHIWYGYLGTLEIKPMKNFNIQTGLDWRAYTGQHWQEVRNLLGADYVYDISDKTVDYTKNKLLGIRQLGDKISYNYDGYVNWIGGFLQMEYKMDALTTYLNSSISNTGYQRKDYFRLDTMPNGSLTSVQNFLGYTIKAGANYNINRTFNVFGNAGYYSRAPLFRNVFDYDNSLYDNIRNEKITALEIGSGYYTRDFKANLNLYWTIWKDRSWYTSTAYTDPITDETQTFYYNLPGLSADHKGIEFDFNYRILKQLRIRGMISIGDWRWTNDVIATYTPESVTDSLGNPITFTTKVYAKDLKVGDAAQTTGALTLTYYPMQRTSLSVTYTYFTNYYARFDPETRTDSTDRAQPWQIPSFGLLDAHFNMSIPINLPFDIKLTAHAYNILGTKYISDAYDWKEHDANTNRVWVGMPFRWNLGLQIEY